MAALRSLKDDDFDLGPVARDLAKAHADLLTAGMPVTVSSLLVEVGRCPSCTRVLSAGVCGYCSKDAA